MPLNVSRMALRNGTTSIVIIIFNFCPIWLEEFRLLNTFIVYATGCDYMIFD